MDIRVIIWGVLMHVQFLYNFWEFLQFFPELCDTRGPLEGPQGPRGGPPKVPGAPQGSSGVTELWKKLQKFPKII